MLLHQLLAAHSQHGLLCPAPTHAPSVCLPPRCRVLSDSKSANERRMASCADLLITSTTMFWQLYPFK